MIKRVRTKTHREVVEAYFGPWLLLAGVVVLASSWECCRAVMVIGSCVFGTVAGAYGVDWVWGKWKARRAKRDCANGEDGA